MNTNTATKETTMKSKKQPTAAAIRATLDAPTQWGQA